MNKKIEELLKRHEEQLEKFNPFQVVGSLKECYKCHRKILVERVLFGISHTSNVEVTCWDCLSDDGKKKAKSMYDITDDGK